MPCIIRTVHASGAGIAKAFCARSVDSTLVRRGNGPQGASLAMIFIGITIGAVAFVSLFWCWAKRSNMKAHARRKARFQGGYNRYFHAGDDLERSQTRGRSRLPQNGEPGGEQYQMAGELGPRAPPPTYQRGPARTSVPRTQARTGRGRSGGRVSQTNAANETVNGSRDRYNRGTVANRSGGRPTAASGPGGSRQRSNRDDTRDTHPPTVQGHVEGQ